MDDQLQLMRNTPRFCQRSTPGGVSPFPKQIALECISRFAISDGYDRLSFSRPGRWAVDQCDQPGGFAFVCVDRRIVNTPVLSLIGKEKRTGVFFVVPSQWNLIHSIRLLRIQIERIP